ncbi:uroporphyrinogen-III synthase [Agromyces badenianii]|uniref:Uroporphyrinogen-III synthase n=1 Tax=Agromyces badenianii TaxID=2080742 RepID=A0A2S0WWU3_9MICO|nr:uroporphyrinogen-III synthase [Agromyces badenianii]AWB95768.1 uroporphyrinogen-III synthase [Agromyces badenianii]PWC03939.1 uroporphyrinogen-III synthase [Agromyces badenianii]
MTELVEFPPGFRPDQLEGFRIGVTSDRRSADLIDALARRGAQVLHAPTLRMANAVSDDPVIADTRAVIEARPDVLLATTAYGVRRWFEVADAAGLGEDLIDALSETAILVRGPKARGGIRAAGLNDAGMSAQETTESLIDEVLATKPPGLTVAVQLHGFLNPSQLDRLREAHDRVLTVEPYRWTEPDETDERVDRLIEAACTGGLDCITFTSAPAVHALFAAAEVRGRHDDLVDAMCGPVVAAAVGPVTAAPLIAAGIVPIQPERFRMGALIRLVCEHLESARVLRLDTRHGPLELRGAVVDVDDRRVALAPVALMILRALVLARGSVVARERLTSALPGTNDEHALEVALSRLRQTIGVPGLIATVVKRGYRLDV